MEKIDVRFFIVTMLCVFARCQIESSDAQTTEAKKVTTQEIPPLRERLVAIDRQRSRSTASMRELEQMALSLLSKDSSEKDKSEVYAAIATMYANDGMRRPSKIVKYCEKALRGKTEPLRACQLYIYWGEALERLANDGNSVSVGRKRDALVIYLRGLKLVAENQTAQVKQEPPTLGRYRYDGPKDEPRHKAMLKKRSEAAAARQTIMVQNELQDYRRILSDKCVQLYSESSNSLEEFENIARGILKDDDLLKELIEAIRTDRKAGLE